MGEGAAALGLFAALCLALPFGFPVAFTLAGVAALYALCAAAFGAFDLALLAAAPARVMGVLRTPELAAVPLFIFMGAVLDRSGVAARLLAALAQAFGRRRGGLGFAGLAVGAMMAACAGVIAASVTTLTTMAAGPMRKAGYRDDAVAGLVCAAGALGQILPPSILLIFLAVTMQSAHAEAMRAQGQFAPDPVTAGEMFAAAIPAGLLLVALYGLWFGLRSALDPGFAPPARLARAAGGSRILRAVLPPGGLIALALGAILFGLATPTEAAALGALGAVLAAGLRDDRPDAPILAGVAGFVLIAALGELRGGGAIALGVLGYAALGWGLIVAIRRLGAAFGEAARAALKLTAMAFAIVIGASLFALVFRGLGGDRLVAGLFDAAPGGVAGAVAIAMLALFLLGFLFDFLEILFVALPLLAPPLLALGVDPLWLAVMVAVNLQTSFLTPPFGYALFYFRGAAPPDLATGALYRGVAPYVGLQLIALALIAAFPAIATALPEALFSVR